MARYRTLQEKYPHMFKSEKKVITIDESPAKEQLPAFLQFKDRLKAWKEIMNKADSPSAEFQLRRLSDELRKNSDFMSSMIYFNPRAYLYIDESINTPEFRLQAVKDHGLVYNLLTEEQRREPGIFEAHFNWCCKNEQPRSRYVSNEVFYSPERFKDYYKSLLEGNPTYRAYGAGFKRYWEDSPAVSFLKEAYRRMPELRAKYFEARREAMLENPEQVAKTVHTYREISPKAWLDEVEKVCPEFIDTVIKDYREANWDSLQKEVEKCMRQFETSIYGEWLKGELEIHEERFRPKFSEFEGIKSTEDVIAYIEEHRDEIEKALEEGNITPEDIVAVFGMDINDLLGVDEQTQNNEQNTAKENEEHEQEEVGDRSL